jgi:hypothetical protein
MKSYLLPVAILLFLASCAPDLRFHHKVDQMVADGDYQGAYALVEENREEYTENSAALFYADTGTLAHYAGRPEESIEMLLQAEKIIEELYTTSISKEATTFIVNDTMAPYKGEDFENVMLNLFLALDYLEIGEIDEALVEARKVDSKLNLINSSYPPDKKNRYNEDAFVRYLMGILYEISGTMEDLNDAFISYENAEQIYAGNYWRNYKTPVPISLEKNLLTMAGFMGGEEFRSYKKKCGSTNALSLSDKQQKAELYFIHYNGKSPEKVAGAIYAPMPDGYVMKIVFPQYRLRPYNIRSSIIRLTDMETGKTTKAKTELGENIAAIAVESLENRKVRIAAKAIARATAKYLATKEAKRTAKNEQGELASDIVGLLGNIVAAVTEQADLRCWKTLPAEIRIGTCNVDPGSYKIVASLLNKTGRVVRQISLGETTLNAGGKKFFFFRTID